VIANDTLAIPSSAAHPVLAHHFLDYLLDPFVAKTNFSYTGYQPPSNGVNPTTLVADGLVAPSLAGAIISPDDLHVGLRLTELPPDAQQLWDAAYRQLHT
jgi:spermidine/putrescine-binding protein